METNNNGAQEAQSGTVKPIWEVLGSQTDAVTIEKPTTPEITQTTDVIDSDAPLADAPKTVEAPAADAPKVEGEKPVVDGEAKPDPLAADAPKTDALELEPVLELKPDDIKDVPATYEDGTFQALGEDFGLTLPEESYEAFKAAHEAKYILREEAEKQNITTKEQLFKTLDPKLATAFELIEMGVPPELAMNPTKVQDDYLAMDSAQLVRAAVEAQKGWDETMVDAEMERLLAEPEKLEVQAKIIRANLNNEKQNILQEQQQIAQKYTEQKQQVALQQKIEADNQFKKVLAEEQAFMGLTLSKEVKDAILLKYNKGAYETALNPAQAKLRAILQLEYGEKFAKVIESKAKQQAKADVIGKLSDVPPKVTPAGGARQQVVVADNHENKGAFANMPFVH